METKVSTWNKKIPLFINLLVYFDGGLRGIMSGP